VVKYNYTQTERFALIEFIACIKGLASVLLKADGLLSLIIRSHIHDEVQVQLSHLELFFDMLSFITHLGIRPCSSARHDCFRFQEKARGM